MFYLVGATISPVIPPSKLVALRTMSSVSAQEQPCNGPESESWHVAVRPSQVTRDLLRIEPRQTTENLVGK